MISKPTPERPFQHMSVDFASYGGRQFLIIVDCKTNWPDIIEMGKDTTARKLTIVLRDQFCRTAAPDLLWSDGGPQFMSHHLAEFLQTWGVSHKKSSPHYPQSNGKAEATVKSMKKLISAAWTGCSIDWNKLSRALLQYRNTPVAKMDSHLLRSYSGTQCTIPSLPTAGHSHRSGRSLLRRSKKQQTPHKRRQNPSTTNMLTIYLTFRLVTMLPCKTQLLNCGTFMGLSLRLDHTGGTSKWSYLRKK